MKLNFRHIRPLLTGSAREYKRPVERNQDKIVALFIAGNDENYTSSRLAPNSRPQLHSSTDRLVRFLIFVS